MPDSEKQTQSARARESLETDLAARVNPELSRRFSTEAFQANHDALMDLGRHARLAPSRANTTISVVGSNGKGSVAWFLAALLGQSGRRVGLYTSPHLSAFNERIRLNLEPAPFEDLFALLPEVRDIAEPGERRWTYFEILTLLALRYFQEQACRALVFEAGLGGRLDATRMLRPRLAVLTVIEAEHVSVLGATLEEILSEKLGIMTPETRTLCVMPQPHLSEDQVREAARRVNPETRTRFFPGELHGTNYLEYNYAFARFCLEESQEDHLPPADKAGAVPPPPGRMETAEVRAGERTMRMLFDTAHNAPGFRATLESLLKTADFPGADRCLLLYGMLPDRDPRDCITVAEAVGFSHIMGIRADFLHEPAGPAAAPREIAELIRAGEKEFELIIMLGSHRIYEIYLEIVARLRVPAAGTGEDAT